MDKQLSAEKGHITIRNLSTIDNRNRFHDNSKIFFKELQKGTLGKDSPGTGAYDASKLNEVANSHKQSFSFSKVKKCYINLECVG